MQIQLQLLVLNLILISTNNSSTVVVYPQIDTDGDGIGNITDLDDDNDGILDSVETGSCANAIIEGYKATVYDGVSNQDSWALISAATTFPVAGFTKIATFDYNEFHNTPNGLYIDFLENPFGLATSTDGDVSNYSGSTIPNDGLDNDAAIVFSRKIDNIQAGTYTFLA